MGAKVVVRLEVFVRVGFLTFTIPLPHCVTPPTLEAIVSSKSSKLVAGLTIVLVMVS